MAEAGTPEGHPNPLYPSFLLKEPHFVGGACSQTPCKWKGPMGHSPGQEMTTDVWVELLGKLLRRWAGSASSSPSSYLESR